MSEVWTRVAFGEVVRLRRERSTDPLADGLDRYVGLEHLDPGDLRIRRWGDVADGTTFTNVFRSGHVLFGKRRAYQRKVAAADFMGLCSGDIYVFESSTDVFTPSLLAHLCASDAFTSFAIRNSAGSLSPRTTWDSLSTFEFGVPGPLRQQLFKRVIEAADRVSEHLRTARQATADLVESTFRILVERSRPEWMRLDEIAKVERGRFSHRPRNLPEFYGGTADFVQTGDVAASQGVLGPASQTLSPLGKSYSRSFPAGAVLITIAAVIGATAVTNREVWCPDSVVGVVPDAMRVVPEYLELSLRASRRVLDANYATITTQKNINLSVLRPLPVPIVSLARQVEIVEMCGRIERSVLDLEKRATDVARLAAVLMQEWVSES